MLRLHNQLNRLAVYVPLLHSVSCIDLFKVMTSQMATAAAEMSMSGQMSTATATGTAETISGMSGMSGMSEMSMSTASATAMMKGAASQQRALRPGITMMVMGIGALLVS